MTQAQRMDASLSNFSSEPLALDSGRFEVRSLFPTPFIYAPVHEPEALNEALRQVILDRAQAHPGVALSNAGGWQSGDDFEAWSGEAGRLLLDLARRLGDSVTGMMQDGQFLRGAPAWKINAWANVNFAGHANRVHHHPGNGLALDRSLPPPAASGHGLGAAAFQNSDAAMESGVSDITAPPTMRSTRRELGS